MDHPTPATAATPAAPASSAGSAGTAERTETTPRERLAVGLLLLSTFVVILNETVMGVALPRLMADLDISPAPRSG